MDLDPPPMFVFVLSAGFSLLPELNFWYFSAYCDRAVILINALKYYIYKGLMHGESS